MPDFASLCIIALTAAGFGVLGLAGQLTWPMLRSREGILAIQFCVPAAYGIQYALLGAWSGTGVALVGASQTVLAYFALERPALRRAGYAFLPLVAIVCASTWSGLPSAFAMIACSLAMIARMQRCTIRLRLIALSAAPFGIGHDASVGAHFALIGAVVSGIIGIAALRRELLRQSTQPANNQPDGPHGTGLDRSANTAGTQTTYTG